MLPGGCDRIPPRFGLALKESIDMGVGVADIDYCEVGVILFNFGKEDLEVKMGKKIA